MKIIKGDNTRYQYDYSEFFSLGDFYVFGGESPAGRYELNENLLKALTAIARYFTWFGIKVTSAFRTQSHNEELKAAGYRVADNSHHLNGQALDFQFVLDNQTRLITYRKEILSKGKLYTELVSLGVGEFEFGATYNHIAIQPNIVFIDQSTVVNLSNKLSQDNVKKLQSILAIKDYYEYHHQDSSVTTIDELVSMANSVVATVSITAEDFCKYKPGDYSNLDRIWELYTEDQRIKFPVKKYVPGLEINVGTLLYIPKNKANVEVLSAQGKDLFMQQQYLKAFMSEEIKALLSDPLYIKAGNLFEEDFAYSVNYLHLSFNCWIYIRALDKIFNITPFVRSMDTTVADGGGSFSFSLIDITDPINVHKYSETYYSYVQKVMNNAFVLSFFQKYIQQNDIVFLRYERLDIEGDIQNEINKFEIDPSSLPGKVYDMIGLVDMSSENYSPDANMTMLNVSGRDFTKMIVEDSSVFFPFALVNGGKEFFVNYDETNTVFKRLFTTGEFMTLFTMLYRSIRDSLGFIFNQLTHVGVLPKDSKLFDAYKNSYNIFTKQNEDRTSKVYQLNGASKEYLDSAEQNGVWKIIKVIVDHQLDNRRLNNGELSCPEGTIIDLVKRICTEPLVEFWGDTYGDQFVFIARQAPFTKEQIVDYFKDPKNKVIEIASDVVAEFNVNWDETYYSWYQVQPLEGLLGAGQYSAATFMPIVVFQEYASLFGMHKRVITDTYLSANVLSGEQENVNIDLYRKSLANDLKFVIESTSILPFTRKGTIRISGGDRRIKKGMWIWFKPTNEIFYVKAVANSISINGNTLSRETALTVERGMLKQYVIDDTEINNKGKVINYFDIVNMDIIVEALQIKLVDDKVKLSTSGTNVKLIDTDLFDFFSKRQQW